MRKEELIERIKQHAMWLADDSTGERFHLKEGEDLYSANLKYANLESANLKYANLESANLYYANLESANLYYANLESANLYYANLKSANLKYANLYYANLKYANLESANLKYANLKLIKNDFFERLLIAKNEIIGLYDYMIRGRVNGLVYEGECACFVGTIANYAKENIQRLSCGLKPDSNSLTEKWFLGISKDDTPQNNQVSKITCDWIIEFCDKNNIKLPDYKLVSSFAFPQCFNQKKL